MSNLRGGYSSTESRIRQHTALRRGQQTCAGPAGTAACRQGVRWKDSTRGEPDRGLLEDLQPGLTL